MTAFLIIVGILVILYLLSKLNNSEALSAQDNTPKKDFKSDNDYYNQDDDPNICDNCKGLGREYYCKTCYSSPSFSGFSEHYDGDLYCAECMEAGRPSDNIVEEYCLHCGGSGKK